MNALKLITSDNEFFNGITQLVYFLLISDTKQVEDKLQSTVEFGSVYARLRHFEEDDIDTAIAYLTKEGYIDIAGEFIIIGTYTGKAAKLFQPKRINCERELKSTMGSAITFSKEATGRNKAKALQNVSDLISLIDVAGYTKWTVKSFLTFWRIVYESYNQDFFREFMEKEFGQMKTLCKLYDPTMLVKMIHFHITNPSLNGNSIGALLLDKDSISATIRGGKKEKLRKEIADEDF